MNEHFVSVPEPEYEALCAAKDAAEARVRVLAGVVADVVRVCEAKAGLYDTDIRRLKAALEAAQGPEQQEAEG